MHDDVVECSDADSMPFLATMPTTLGVNYQNVAKKTLIIIIIPCGEILSINLTDRT
jgi:hypothetical protein